MSYSKNNPPWLATSSAATPSLQAQIGLANPMLSFQAAAGQPPVFSQPQAPPPPNISLITQMAAAASVQQQPQHTLYTTQTVSYPAPRPIAYPQMQALHPQPQQMSPQMPPSMQQVMPSVVSCPTVVQSNIMATQRAYHGTVTKIQGDVGFIDDEIFFHKSVVCKGSMPKVGERVFVEASYASNTPFKWNASRVQLLTVPATKSSYNNNNSHLSPSGSASTAAENGAYARTSGIRSSGQSSSHHRERSPRRSTDRERGKRVSSGRDSAEQERRRTSRREEVREKRDRRDHPSPTRPLHVSSSDRRDQRSSPATRGTHHNRSLVSSHTTRGSVSPPPVKKRRRVVPRYLVQIPKVSLKLPHADVWALKQRYQNLYVPSDFFHSEVRWAESFPPDNPFVLRQPCAFQLMHKEIAPPPETAADETLLDPPDADHSFVAKVMLMSVPPMADIYRQCFVAAENEEGGDLESGGAAEDANRNLVHPSRMVSFLVGMKGGKNETMAIGGAWSPSLDGKHPESDPTVLIRTAIRTCKALTGIDLSRCTQWYRFVELYYYRRESGRGTRETVVVFMPDVRSCVPTADEWTALKGQYKTALQRVLDQNHNSSKASNSNVEQPSSDSTSKKSDEIDVERRPATKEPAQTISGVEAEEKEATDADQQPMETCTEGEEKEEAIEIDQKKGTADTEEQKMEIAVDDKEDTVEAIEEADNKVNEGADNQQLEDVKAMKMPELKEALAARNLPTKGLKADLVERLKEALERESKEQTLIEEEVEKQAEKEEEKSSSPQHSKDESNESMEDGEPDLANMIVIDEVCDPLKQQPTQEATSTAADEEEEEVEHLTKEKSGDEKGREKDKKEAMVAKKLTEKDIRQLQRRYTLPETPEIIVHPSRTAKGGKFDCALMSLSVLLDYGLDDSKEHSFEVYLFAELFNEMLMRDSGFNIYKALEGLPERRPEAEADERERRDNKKEAVVVASGSGEGTAIEDGAGEGRKREAKQRKKQITVNPELLLSFAYFDQSLCGYILCKDLEDLMSSLGLGLSKSQIRKVVKKGTVSDSLYYRKLTDKDKEEAESQAVDAVDADVTFLAKGNAPLLPVFKVAKIGESQVGMSSSRLVESAISGDNDEAGGALVMFNGTLVNVEKLMERIKTAERALLDAEQVLVDVKRDNVELSASNGKANAKIKDLTGDLKSATKKLGDSEATAHSLQRKNSEYLSVITSIQDKIAPCLAVKRERSSSGKDTKVEVKASSGGGNGGKTSVEEKTASVKKEK